MLCRHCNAENPETAKFCVNCGQALSPPLEQPTKTLQTESQKATADRSPQPGTKLAAICVWIVCALLVVVGYTAFGPTSAETDACIRAGGSGVGCGGAHFPAPLFWLAAFFGAGYGAKLWARK
jgi:hypothetical protein